MYLFLLTKNLIATEQALISWMLQEHPIRYEIDNVNTFYDDILRNMLNCGHTYTYREQQEAN
jgi:hypothetical protein